jgi:hypothetical protein
MDAPGETEPARVVLLSRDPEWLFCYWDISPALKASHRPAESRLTLRLHDVTVLDFDGNNGWSQHLYPLTEEARWWHVPVPHPGRHYLAEVGYATAAGTFTLLGRSGGVSTLVDKVAASGPQTLVTVDIDAPRSALDVAAPGPGGEGASGAAVATGGGGPLSEGGTAVTGAGSGALAVVAPGDRPWAWSLDARPTSPGVPPDVATAHPGSSALWSRQP